MIRTFSAPNLLSDFDGFFGRPNAGTVPTDVVRFSDRVEVLFDLPGVAVDDIDLTVENRQLTLSANRPAPSYEDGTVVGRERRTGSVQRKLHLSQSIDPSNLTASYTDGVLTVTLPVSEAAKPQKVTISATQPAIPATAD